MAVSKPLDGLIVALPAPIPITLKLTDPTLETVPPGSGGMLVEVIDSVPPTFIVVTAVVLLSDKPGVLRPIVINVLVVALI
jgi:hypothetical protein